jgi:hypothetical protein
MSQRSERQTFRRVLASLFRKCPGIVSSVGQHVAAGMAHSDSAVALDSLEAAVASLTRQFRLTGGRFLQERSEDWDRKS